MAIFNSVFGGELARKPWANTVAYYPLAWDTNDYSWNNHHLSNWTQPTFTTSWDLTYWVSSWSARPYTNSFSMTSTVQTVVFWIMITVSQTSRWIFNLRWDNSWAKEHWWIYWTNYNPALCFYPAFAAWNYKGVTPDINKRYNVWAVFNVDDWTTKVYVNWEYKWVDSRWLAIWSNLVISLFWSSNNNDNCNCAYSNFIVESWERTADKFTKYYNQTKWLYS